MRAHRGFIVVMALVVVMARPSLAAAQLSNRGLGIAPGQKVLITTGDGRTTKGQVISLSPATVEIGEAGVTSTSLAVADVQRVQETDSVTNGVIKGALTLGLAGLIVGGLSDASSALTNGFGNSLVLLLGGQPEPIKQSNHALTGAIAGVAVGSLLGYALDSAKMKTLYEREDGGLAVAVRPIVSAAGKGVGVSVRW